MTVEASSSKCANPPRLNRPRSSSYGPPGPCITPSTETCAVVVSFMVAFPFSLGFCCRSIRPDRGADPTGRSRVRPADPFRTLPEHGQQDAHQRSSILKLLTVRRARSVRKAPEHRDETDEEQRDTDGQHEEERPQVTEGRRHLRQDLLRSMGDDHPQTLNNRPCRRQLTVCHWAQLGLDCSHGARPCPGARGTICADDPGSVPPRPARRW